MLWMFESKEYAVILAASFLAGLLMDMILKKVTKQGETKYTAFLSVCITAVFLGTYGTNEHALVCTLFGQMLLYASEYDLTTHTVPDYVHVLLLLIGLLEIQFVPALLGLVLVPLPFLAAALGLTCIILSLIICFGLTPMFNNALKSKVSIIRESV